MHPHSALAFWRTALLVAALAPLGYYLAAILAAVRFRRRAQRAPLPQSWPAVSILKPLHGVDFASAENFASFCNLDYPEYEILFAVNDDGDPAVPLVEKLIRDFPSRRIRLLTGAPALGANRKVNSLARMAAEAAHGVLVLTDGDVRVGPNFLREIVAPLAAPPGTQPVALVSCLYRGVAQKNLGAELEALGASTDFLAGALLAAWGGEASFALGAAIAITRTQLERIGGFAAIANCLADDYELGHRTAQSGARAVLCREPVWTMYPAQSVSGFWHHQVRWARTVRLCRPPSYLGLLLTHGLPWALLASALAPSRTLGAAYLLAYFLLRFAMAGTVGVWLLRDETARRRWWLVPLRDAIHFFVWLAGFASNRVVWGGVEYLVEHGEMHPAGGASRAASVRG